MFLALRELRFARTRFALMGAVIALVSVLVVLLSGLSAGLVNDGVSGLKQLPVTHFSFEGGTKTDAAFTRSIIDVEQVDKLAEQPGVTDAAPYGLMLANAKKDDGGQPVDLTLVGVEEGSFVAPSAVAEGDLVGQADGIVVSSTAKDAGLELGDRVTLERLDRTLTVVGILPEQHTFGHVDIAYLPLATWQELHAGGDVTVAADAEVPDVTTAAALRVDGDFDPAATDAALGTTTLTLKASFGASPGYSAETATLMLIQVFLYAISALVVGAFFTVWTIQRRHEIAVMRAMGATRKFLLADSLGQAALLLAGAIGTGFAVGIGLGALLQGTAMPFALQAPDLAVAAVLLVVLGMVGATAAVIRITSVDPLTALGGQR
ncbi:FtsX-like permease family protein [Sanguibacter hominis ATCC BAA-789]|uniref:FtsX-like permease family protein n=1 Tax=Sanguibacter hominis ATCC BAA-789 TaxID=1312740 RepID=A0A9X5ISC4_9MICO|nr:FtsX-like permease family protein [Sanguibacter hominis]NKX92886.1 FtsX-like permease family protein [Sanguibacter hominis ATCC BAA-789]